MKRKLSVLLIFALLLNLIMPVSVFAEEDETFNPGYDQEGNTLSDDPWGDAFPDSKPDIHYPESKVDLDNRADLYVDIFDGETVVTVKKGETFTFPAAVASGSVAVDPDATTVTLTDINFNSTRFEGSEQPIVAINGYQMDTAYTVQFVGDCNFGYCEEPEAEEMCALYGIFGGGSTVKFQGIAGEYGSRAKLDARGILMTEVHSSADRAKVTKFVFEDLDIRSHSYTVPITVMATQFSFDNCDLEAQSYGDVCCFYAGMANDEHDTEIEFAEFKNCDISMVNNFDYMIEESVGLIVSAYMSDHSTLLLKDCNTYFSLEHCLSGECRGLMMLNGGFTVDGGTLISRIYGTPEESARVEDGCAVQAVYANIRNGAEVNLSAELSRTAWGLIYAQNVYVDDSEFNVTVHGKQSNDQGIYYFGKSTSEGEAIAPVGHAEFKNSKVNVDVTGVSRKYNVGGISCRYFVADNSDISVKTVAEDENTVLNAVRAYNFDNNGGLILKNARIKSPIGATIGLTKIEKLKAECYSILGKDGEHVDQFRIVPVTNPKDDSDDSNSSSSLKIGVAAMKVPAANAESGIWDRTADGKWTFTGEQGLVRNRWVLAVNPYGGADAAGWFYMDENGIMLTGWQLIAGKWYYLNKNADGWQGACLMNTITPDGYRVGTDGSWIQK